MKKIFLAPLLFLAPQANAGELTYDVHGGAKGFYGYSDVSERYEKDDDNNDFKGKAEVNFSTEYEVDQETKFGAYLDVMKGFNKGQKDYNNGDWGKELYGTADSAYGRVMLGETYNVANQFHQGTETVGDIDAHSFISNPNWDRGRHSVEYRTLNSTAINTDGVAPKITYITPEYSGTMLGFTYINDINNRRGLTNQYKTYSDNDGYVSSIYNTHDFGFAEISTSVSYAEFREDDKEFAGSMKLARGNWSLAGSYRKAYIDGKQDPISADLSDNYREGYAWDVGAGYEIGPYKVSLTYFNSKAENTKNRDDIVMLSNQYQVNKWADVYLAAAHVRYEGADKDVDNNSKGYAFITGLGVHF